MLRTCRPLRFFTWLCFTQKFYLAATSERRYALLGSANMYEWSRRSFELGVIIESRGEGETLMDQLEELAIELRVTKHTIKA